MTKQELIDHLQHLEQYTHYSEDAPALRETIAMLKCSEVPNSSDTISRQAAISAICNACGKIDCDKMDKCEKLQLPPANCSEFPNNSDTISRQAAGKQQ